jgi:hypothetical protein
MMSKLVLKTEAFQGLICEGDQIFESENPEHMVNIAAQMKLSVEEIEWSLEQHGGCSTEWHELTWLYSEENRTGQQPISFMFPEGAMTEAMQDAFQYLVDALVERGLNEEGLLRMALGIRATTVKKANGRYDPSGQRNQGVGSCNSAAIGGRLFLNL